MTRGGRDPMDLYAVKEDDRPGFRDRQDSTESIKIYSPGDALHEPPPAHTHTVTTSARPTTTFSDMMASVGLNRNQPYLGDGSPSPVRKRF